MLMLHGTYLIACFLCECVCVCVCWTWGEGPWGLIMSPVTTVPRIFGEGGSTEAPVQWHSNAAPGTRAYTGCVMLAGWGWSGTHTHTLDNGPTADSTLLRQQWGLTTEGFTTAGAVNFFYFNCDQRKYLDLSVCVLCVSRCGESARWFATAALFPSVISCFQRHSTVCSLEPNNTQMVRHK